MASRQTATITTSCSIWLHEILSFNTSTFPSFYSLCILAHFQVFTVQSHATQFTTLCADERGYMSNTSSLLFSIPVIFVLDRERGRVRCFCLGISKGSCINPFQEVRGPRLFSQKNSNIPAHPPIKNVPSLTLFKEKASNIWIQEEISLGGCKS